MKSQRIIKETFKTEKLPQGKTTVLTSRRNKNGLASNVYTVKETTLEKRVKRSFNTEVPSTSSYKTTSILTNLKQGTNSGNYFQNRIPVSNRDDINKVSIIKTTRSSKNFSERFPIKRYSKNDIDKIIKIQRWWRRILAILKGYEIRETLFSQNNNGNYILKSQKIYTEKYTTSNRSSNNSNLGSIPNIKNSNYTSLNNIKNSKSYTNINNITTTATVRKNLITNTNTTNTSFSPNYMQTVDKRVITQTSPRGAQSGSTSPSVKSKYIIETKKVEVFRKPKNNSINKFVKEENINKSTSITNYEVKQLMKDIWSNETYCSTVESLCCLGDDGRSNISQNTAIYEEYEEEIRKLKSIIMQKDDELNNLATNLKQTKKELNINITKNLKMKNAFNKKSLDQDAHELQIISTKRGWNDINIPSPVSEMFIESIENKMPPRMQYIEGMQIMGKKQEESIVESISDPEAVLEIQEMNALSIISNKKKYKNICQHLQSLMILSKRNEESEEFSLKEKEEKNTALEVIPVEKEPLVFQKIEQINFRSIIKPKPRKPRNQIQELDGLEIINYRRPKLDLKRKTKPKLTLENIDKIFFKYEEKKVEKPRNTIQELDGLEIIKSLKKENMPQCVDELEISREYDMLLVKPTWNSLQIQGSGLNLLAIPRDTGLENQEVDEFEILGMEKPELYIESLEKISYEKPKQLQKIQVLIPLPENKIKKQDNFRIYGIRKEPEKKVEKKVAPLRIRQMDKFRIYGIKKEPEVKIVEKIVEKKVERAPNKIVNFKFLIAGRKRVVKNKILNLERLFIKGREKVDIKKIMNLEDFVIKGREKVDIKKIMNIEDFIIKGREKVDNKRVIKNEKIVIRGKPKKEDVKKIVNLGIFQIKGRAKSEMKKIIKNDRMQIDAEEKEDNKIVKNDKIHFKGKPKKVVINKVIKNDKIQLAGEEKVENNRIIKSDKLLIKGKGQKVVGINKVIKNDKIQLEGEEKIDNKQIIKKDRIQLRGKEQKVVKNRIIKNEKIIYKGKERKVVKNRISKVDKFIIEGLEKEEIEPEENIEDNVIEFSIIKKQKKVVTNKIKRLERFIIKGIQKPKEEYVPVKRKGFAEKINKTVITKKEEEVIEPQRSELFVENIENLNISKDYSTKQEIHEFGNLNIGRRLVISLYGTKKVEKSVRIEKKQEIKQEVQRPKVIEKKVSKDWNKLIKPNKATKLLIKNAYEKVIIPKQPQQQIIEKEEIETVEKVYKNWNDEIKPIKTTKLNIKGEPKKIEKVETIEKVEKIEKIEEEKEKEEFDIENFAINLTGSEKKFRESLHIESGGFDLEGSKAMILKEGPAQTIKVTKEQVLVPSKVLQFNLLSKVKKIEKVIEKVEKVEKVVKEAKKPKIVLKSVKENKLFIKGIKTQQVKQIQQSINEKIKTVEKIVEVEKKIDWNKVNKIRNEGKINLLTKIKKIVLAKQRTNTINLKGTGKKEVQIIEKKSETQKIITKDWKNSLHAQRNAKFALLGKQKIKKYKLVVENGVKIFIQKESEDEIIYNDDYNSRKEKQKLKNENEQKKQIIREKEIIKEKETIPRYKREVRAQISRLKESESETSSTVSEIDVLAAIKSQRTVGYGASTTTGAAPDTGIIGYKKTGDFKGYQTKIISGEVEFTAKNGIGVNLGGTEYQKRIITKTGYTKKFSSINGNKMSGIEIVNPNVKTEIYYQKMTGASGAIGEGNYKIIDSRIINDKGLTGSISCKQMKVVTNSKNININNIPQIGLENNGQNQSYRKQVIITSKTENVQNSELNGSPSSNVILKKRTKDSKNSGNNNSRIKDSPKSGNSGNNSYNINQQISSGKLVFNSRLKTDGSENSKRSIGDGKGQNKTITTTRQYEMRIKTNGDNNEKVITESKKTTEVKFKSNKKTKNVQLLRDDNY